ncbi:MAG: 3-hydroxyacyl-CoA dehydrogenase family protein, partial [Sphingobium sp.]
DAVIEKMVTDLGRLGRKNGKGFYDYPADGGEKRLWSGLEDHWPWLALQPTPAMVRERLLYRQLIECARCYEEGVLTAPEDGDIGAIFGWGFATWTGGPFSHMDTVGIGKVVETLDRLTQVHGDRFAPTKQLREMAAKGDAFYRGKAKAAA